MNTSDSEEDVCNERTALVQSQSPSVPNYNREPGLNPQDGEPKRVSDLFFPFSLTNKIWGQTLGLKNNRQIGLSAQKPEQRNIFYGDARSQLKRYYGEMSDTGEL